jgi:mRNA interferase MazF
MSPGDIVLVKFPFANLENAKKRPALLLKTTKVSSKGHLMTIAMITSKIEGLDLDGDVVLDEWQKAKLLHPSLVRLAKIATIDSELIERKLGRLSSVDHEQVGRVFSRLYSHWVK